MFESDAKHMANDVNEILIDIAEKEGAMSKTDAKQFIENLGKKSRYLQDVWSWSALLCVFQFDREL